MNENNNTNNQSNNSFLYNPLTIDNSNEEHENENIPTSSTPNFIPNNNNNPSPIVAPVTPAVSEVNSNDVSSTPNFIPNADKPASPITAPTPEVNSNSEQPNVLNMQPQMMPLSNNESTPNPVGDSQQRDSKFLINQTPNDTNLNLNNTNQEINQQLGIQQEQNRFFDTNASYNETTINDLNVSGNYNHLNKKNPILLNLNCHKILGVTNNYH